MDDSATLARLREIVEGVDSGAVSATVERILAARRVFGYGVGREGLVVRGLIMRLCHCGLQAYVVGEMVTPDLGPQDLLLLSAGPGYFSTAAALSQVARLHGGSILVVTAQSQPDLRMHHDAVLRIPSATMRDPQAEEDPVLPMGSEYELAFWLVADLLVHQLRQRRRLSVAQLAQKHTNLE